MDKQESRYLGEGGQYMCRELHLTRAPRLPAYLVTIAFVEIVLPGWHAQGWLIYLETQSV